MQIDGIELRHEGQGDEAVVLIHGWPDTLALWDAQVAALAARRRCVRFTLPGFDRSQPPRAFSLDEVVEAIHRIVAAACPGERVTLLLHDWGCLYGYQFALRHPEQVARIVGVDIGDAGSAAHRATLGVKAGEVLAYQLYWRWSGAPAAWATAWHAGWRADAPPDAARADAASMGYPMRQWSA